MAECSEQPTSRIGIQHLVVHTDGRDVGAQRSQEQHARGLKRPCQDLSPVQSTPTPKKSRNSFWATVMESSEASSVDTSNVGSAMSTAATALTTAAPKTIPTGARQQAAPLASDPADFDTAHVLSSLRFNRGRSGLDLPAAPAFQASVGSPLSVVTDSDEVQSHLLPEFEKSEHSTDPEDAEEDPVHDVSQHWDSTKPKLHACQDCGSSFARSSHLRLHVGTVHEMKKPYRCDEPSCGALFGHVSSKYRHFRTVHLKRRDFQCTQCGLSFGEKSGLRKHELSVHIGSRPHQCNQCGFRFSFRLHLQQHIATVHEKLRPFSCDVCGHTFGQRSSLNRHMRQICCKDNR
jgi:hypothetical protein